MTDDGHAPTIPDTQAPTHGPSSSGVPRPPDARYTLRSLLGRGGMGEVWLAHDVRVDREIAIKLMRGGADDEDAIARFLREARVQGRLEHPSVVPVHDLGGDDSSPFFAMKRLTGTTLADVIAARDDEKWPRRTLLARFVDVCLAIEFAHKRGVIHRDLKPANIMLGDFGETYVLDWGLARIHDDPDSGAIRTSDLRGDSAAGHTQAGALLGTPGYMAPEQMRGEPIDQRADVYALGCILFELLAGEPAIARDRTFELTLSVPCHRPLGRRSDVPPELDEICAHATRAEPGSRLGSARELADAVQRFLDGDRDLERRRELAAEHARRAQELLVAGTIEARAEAMREAGSAIALDAGNRDAQAVLAHLLLEPPRQLPSEARVTLAADREATARTIARTAAYAYVAFLVLTPLLFLFGVSHIWPIVLIAAENALLAGLAALAYWRRWPLGRPLGVMFLCLHCALIATTGITFGPLFIVPILMFGSATLFAIVPTVSFPKLIVALHMLALVVPLAMEWFGVLPRSFRLEPGGLVLAPWAVELSASALIFVVLSTTLVQLFATAFVLHAQRKTQARAQELLHVQKWQLEQLVPSSGTLA